MWLYLVLFVQLIGFQWPVIQAAYRFDTSPRGGRYLSASQGGDYVGAVYPTYPGVTRNVDSEDTHNNLEDIRPKGVYPSDYYNRNTQDRLTEGPVTMPPLLNFEDRRPNPGRTASSSQIRWPFNGIRIDPPPATELLPRPSNEIILSRTVLKSALGVAIIYSRETGIICSGIHLKPWMLLTTADCVYKKYPEELYAKIMKLDEENGSPVMVPVDIQFYELHPGYHYSDYESHNLAVLLLNSKYNWVVDEFSIPKGGMDNIIPDHAVTYVDDWNEWKTPHNTSYILSTEEKSITRNYTVCNGETPHKNFFCVAAGSYIEVYEQMDIGIPLFYNNGSSKVLIGLYSGKDINKGVTGHMFLSIFDNSFWVTEKLFEYPLPPTIHY